MKSITAFLYRGNTDSGAVSTVNLSATTTIVTAVTDNVTQATASISINSDGTTTVSYYGDNPAWHNSPAAGLGASFWALVAVATGSVTSGTVGSRVQLTNGATWTAVTSGSGAIRTKNVTGTVELWDAFSGGNMVSSGTFALNASVEASQSSGGSTGGAPEFVVPGLDQSREEK
jgi:hypothetical protein